MSDDILKEFDKFLKNQKPSQMETAVNILKVCREYFQRHYDDAVFGTYQKRLIDVIDEFIEEVGENDKNF